MKDRPSPLEKECSVEHFKISNRANRINKERIDAASSRDALTYFIKCQEGGFQPEEPLLDLYLRGYNEFQEKESLDASSIRYKENRKRISLNSQKAKYDFDHEKALQIVQGRNSPSPRDIFSSPQQRDLLRKVFGRLRNEAKMKIPNYSKMDVPTMLRAYNDVRRTLDLL